jgi:hypothetical protein
MRVVEHDIPAQPCRLRLKPIRLETCRLPLAGIGGSGLAIPAGLAIDYMKNPMPVFGVGLVPLPPARTSPLPVLPLFALSYAPGCMSSVVGCLVQCCVRACFTLGPAAISSPCCSAQRALLYALCCMVCVACFGLCVACCTSHVASYYSSQVLRAISCALLPFCTNLALLCLVGAIQAPHLLHGVQPIAWNRTTTNDAQPTACAVPRATCQRALATALQGITRGYIASGL